MDNTKSDLKVVLGLDQAEKVTEVQGLASAQG